ncbi:MspA family porin [Tsukamurella paurometabola]|uniref:MspA n=1 Tax=Tsukamurella paurometabola TaxID=2061 RepID=A0A3P8JVZ1_TSUPA|nr:MspA family porin [Tsukamurella paurometabola]UEA84918.1 MspA family porin [Tsukamurella paurometabola]VDR37509.1 MspA [Tsukamurella paurometabola]
MSKMSKVAGRAGVVAIAVAAAASVAAGSANAGPLPDGQKTVPAPAGWSVVLKSTGNVAKIQGSLATPQSRSAWYSSNGSVTVKAPADAKDIQGKLGVGVIVGCQFPGQIGGGIDVTGPSAGLGMSGPSLGIGGVSGSLGIPLTPGATNSVSGYSRQDQLGSTDSIKFTKPGTYNVTIKDQNVDVKFCSGYAQARVVTWVEIKGSNRVQGFLYGAPFSLG